MIKLLLGVLFMFGMIGTAYAEHQDRHYPEELQIPAIDVYVSEHPNRSDYMRIDVYNEYLAPVSFDVSFDYWIYNDDGEEHHNRGSTTSTYPLENFNGTIRVVFDIEYADIWHLHKLPEPITFDETFQMPVDSTIVFRTFEGGHTHAHEETTDNHIEGHQNQDALLKQMWDTTLATHHDQNYKIAQFNATLVEKGDLWETQFHHNRDIAAGNNQAIHKLQALIDNQDAIIGNLLERIVALESQIPATQGQ